ncbi:acyl carrier protein [Micromonospora sp. DT231]|uniref:acyl carrier protein n=1 Tax=Micromonospora sp. DT231 TaxID=3416526 RepID=UPI003CF1F51B
MTAAVATGVRTELLDCIQANLAVLADRWGEPARHLALGATLRFQPRPGPDGLPTVDPPVRQHLAELTGHVGLVARHEHRHLDPTGQRALAERAAVVYAVGDSYHMPWLPYAGHSHMEHSYLVALHGEEALIGDAYDNETAWGAARPGDWTLPWTRLPMADLAVVYTITDDYRPPSPSVRLDDPAAYLEAYARCGDPVAAARRLTAETWLMSRARKLHAAYRLHRGESLDAEAHLRRWDQLTATAFIALRRVERGRPAPGTLLTDLAAALTADRDVFATRPDQLEKP